MSYPAQRGSRYPEGTGWWDPFSELEAMHRRLDQLFFGTPTARWERQWGGDVDLQETDDGWTVEAQLPGVPPEAVDVDLGDRELSIRGEAGDGSEGGVRARRRFAYQLSLPGEVDADRAEANLENGVLTVRLPRSPRTTTRKLQIGTGGRGAIGATAAGTAPESAGSWDDSALPITAPPAPEDVPEAVPSAQQPYPEATPSPQSYQLEPTGAPYQPEAGGTPYQETGVGAGQPAEAPYETAGYPQPGYGTEPAAAGRYPVPGQAQGGAEQPMPEHPLPDQPPSDQAPGAGYTQEGAGYPQEGAGYPQESQPAYPQEGQPAYPAWTGQEPSGTERREQPT